MDFTSTHNENWISESPAPSDDNTPVREASADGGVLEAKSPIKALPAAVIGSANPKPNSGVHCRKEDLGKLGICTGNKSQLRALRPYVWRRERTYQTASARCPPDGAGAVSFRKRAVPLKPCGRSNRKMSVGYGFCLRQGNWKWSIGAARLKNYGRPQHKFQNAHPKWGCPAVHDGSPLVRSYVSEQVGGWRAREGMHH